MISAVRFEHHAELIAAGLPPDNLIDPDALRPIARADRWLNAAAAAGFYATVEQALYDKQDEWAPTGKIEPILAGVLSPAEMKKVQLIESTDGPQLDAAVDIGPEAGDQKDLLDDHGAAEEGAELDAGDGEEAHRP